MQNTHKSPHNALFVCWGEFFTEVLMTNLDQTQAPSQAEANQTQVYYQPKTSFKQILEKLTVDPGFQPKKVFIATRFFERLFSYSLGGSVAQLISAQEKKFLKLQQTHRVRNLFELEKGPFLASENLTFEIDFASVTDEQLASLSKEMLEKGARRLVIQSTTRDLSQESFEKMHSVFKGAKLEVFPRKYEDLNYISHSRHLLDACLWGRFLEFREDLESTFSNLGHEVEIYYFTHSGIIKNHIDEPTELLFGFENALKDYSKAHQFTQAMELSFEKFFLHQLGSALPTYQNPLGQFELHHTQRIELQTQPSQTLTLDQFQEIEVSKKCYGFDPGPISLGRGQRLLLIDLLLKNEDSAMMAELLAEKIPGTKDKKIALQIQSLQKNSRSPDSSDFLRQLNQLIENRLTLECLSLVDTEQKALIFGFGSKLLGHSLKKFKSNSRFHLSPQLNHTQILHHKVISQ